MQSEKFKVTPLERSWILYDVGNSAFVLMIATLVPIFFNALAEAGGLSSVNYLAYWGYASSVVTVITAVLGPILGTLADTRGFKKPIFMLCNVVQTVHRALVSAGLRVPEDVSVIGFDGITMSRYCVPVLTTVVQPSEQISLQSIELLVRQIEHGAPAQTITLQPELQQGESVRSI